MSGAHPFRVLLVDDEALSRKVIHHILASLGAEHIVVASSYAEARLALNQDPTLRLIISDHYMSDSTGMRLLGDVRQGILAVPNDAFFIISTTSRSFALYRRGAFS